MSNQAALGAQKREGTGKGVTRKLRAAGRVPAVLYGGGAGPEGLSLNTREAERLFQGISAENTVIELSIEGGETVSTLVREIQTHPYKNQIIHVDFLRLQRGVLVDVHLPVHLVGIPAGVRTGGGILDHVLHEVMVRCIPSMIPEAIELDVTALELGENLHVSDISLPEGVELLTDPQLLVCAVPGTRARAEEAEA